MKSWNARASKSRAERRLGFGAQRDELGVAVEVRRRLPRAAKRVPFDLAAGERRRVDQLALEERVRLFRRADAALQLGIEEGAGRAMEPHQQRAELRRGRHVRQNDVLGVERPAFAVDGVEGEHRARQREPALEHPVELHLVAGPRFVRGQRPGDRVVREVVGALDAFLSGRGRDVEREDELTDLPRVPDQRCGIHVGSRRLRALRERCRADPSRARGERQQVLAADDRLDLDEARAVERDDVVRRRR